MTGPQVSAPLGTVRNCFSSPRRLPLVATPNSPSWEPRALPSVEIHRLPWSSKARLSGQEIGLTASFGKPAKYVAGSSGSPATRNSDQANRVLSGRFQRSVSSRTWPCLLALRGLASSAFGLAPVPRLELLVSAT